jgi:hypothetical protein
MSAPLLARLRRWWNKSNRASTSIHGVSLRLEMLEQRTVPSNLPAGFAPPPANQVFLATVYQGELQRPIETAGLSYWDHQLKQNVGRNQVVGAILNSNEYFRRAIGTDYNSLLGRTPDADGLAYWAGQLQQGKSESTVLAGLLGSNEFFSHMQAYTAQLNTPDPNVAAAEFIREAHLFKSQPAVVPAAPLSVVVPSAGDNSGFDTPGGDNSGGATVIADNSVTDDSVTDNSVTDNSATDNSVTDNSVTDNSTADSTNYAQTDCSC